VICVTESNDAPCHDDASSVSVLSNVFVAVVVDVAVVAALLHFRTTAAAAADDDEGFIVLLSILC